MTRKIAFQGEPGAYGHQACVDTRPDHEPLPCPTFEDAIDAVRRGDADLGMIGVENSTYGRVADVHLLLPESGRCQSCWVRRGDSCAATTSPR